VGQQPGEWAHRVGGHQAGHTQLPADEQPESANQLQSEFWQQQQQQQTATTATADSNNYSNSRSCRVRTRNGSSLAEAEAVAQGLLTAANGVEGAMAALASAVDRNREAAEAQGEGLVAGESIDGVPVVLSGVQALDRAPPVLLR